MPLSITMFLSNKLWGCASVIINGIYNKQYLITVIMMTIVIDFSR